MTGIIQYSNVISLCVNMKGKLLAIQRYYAIRTLTSICLWSY